MSAYHKKSKIKANDLPNPEILDLRLEDLPGEQWTDIPMLDGLVMISNKGRIKRMGREIADERGFSYILDEKIVKLKIHHFFNKHLQEHTSHLTGRVYIENKIHYITISRMVYHCFVEPIDLKDKLILVISKDHNGLNMDPGNLIKVSYSEFQQHIRNNNRRDPEFWMKNGKGKPFFAIGQQSRNIEISQYNLKGQLLATFPSIATAATTLGISASSIGAALNEDCLTAHGFIWKKGKSPVIDVTMIIKALNKHKGPIVSQYDLDGKRLRTFEHAEEAATFVGRNTVAIKLACRQKTGICVGYLWRFGASDQLDEGDVGESMKSSVWGILSCYNTDGIKVATYKGGVEASRITGLNLNRVATHAKRPDLLLKGLVWRMGNEPVISKEIIKDAREYVNKNWPREITQYTIEGKRLAIYPTVDAAAKATGIKARRIHCSASGYNFLAGGFVWQRGAGKSKIEFPKLPRKLSNAIKKVAIRQVVSP